MKDFIVIHHSLTEDSGTISWQAIRRYHVHDLKWRDIGYHFGLELVNGEYEILAGRMMDQSGAHCSQNQMNIRSLGICAVGNFDLAPPPPAMWDKLIDLTASLCTVFEIRVDHVVGHREYATYKSCPGKLFDMDMFRQEVRRQL